MERIFFREESSVSPEQVLSMEGVFLKRGRYRDVVRKGDFVVKFIKGTDPLRRLKLTLFTRRAAREVENLKKIISAGFPAPKPIFWGYEKNGMTVTTVIVCVEFVDGRKPGVGDLEALVELLARMNKRGIFPLDPHIENFVIQHNPYIIDAYYVSFSAMGKIRAKKSLAKLLLPAFLELEVEDIEHLVEIFRKTSGIEVSTGEMLSILKKHILSRGKARLRSISREIRRENGRIIAGDGKLPSGQVKLLKKSSRAITIEVDGSVVKISLNPLYKKDRGVLGWLGGRLLQSYEIPAPKPKLLFGKKRGLKRVSFLVMEKLSGKTLDEVVKDWKDTSFKEKNAMVKRLSKLVSSLYLRAIYHSDLKPKNIMWDGENFVLLDPESVRLRAFSKSVFAKNMGQLYKGAGDRVGLRWNMRFVRYMASYLRKISPWTSFRETWRFLLREIERHTKK